MYNYAVSSVTAQHVLLNLLTRNVIVCELHYTIDKPQSFVRDDLLKFTNIIVHIRFIREFKYVYY